MSFSRTVVGRINMSVKLPSIPRPLRMASRCLPCCFCLGSQKKDGYSYRVPSRCG